MAKLRPKQFDSSKIGSSKLGFDGEEDGWVLVKKQRVIIVLPSLPLPEHFTVEKPEFTLSQAELRDSVADTHETAPVHAVVPSLPPPEHFGFQKPATSHAQAALRDGVVVRHETTTLDTVVPSLPLTALRDGIVDTHETTIAQTVVPSRPVTEHYTLQKPVESRSQAELREFVADTPETTLVDSAVSSLPVTEYSVLRKPATAPSQSELRADTHTLVRTMVPSCLVPTLQKHSSSRLQAEKTATSQSQAELRGFVSDTVEPEACPDFTAVDKPDMAKSRNLTTKKAPLAGRRSLQDYRMDQDRRLGIRRNHTGRNRKAIRFPRVMCSSVVMDNEKLRVVNLERKVEKAGGLNEWVRSIGLGREFERMLRGQRMSKFQVANLTMEKLKQMGALAVGPRRKLIHAIHCVYHPHCLRASFN